MELYNCPISGSLIRTPAIAPCGHLFDKRSLLVRLASNKPTCPVEGCGKEITADKLTINDAITEKVASLWLSTSQQKHCETREQLNDATGHVWSNVPESVVETYNKIISDCFGATPAGTEMDETAAIQSFDTLFQRLTTELPNHAEALKRAFAQSMGYALSPPELQEIDVTDEKWLKHPDYINSVHFYREFYGLELGTWTSMFSFKNKIVFYKGSYPIEFFETEVKTADKFRINGISGDKFELTTDLSFVWIHQLENDTVVVACKDIGKIMDQPAVHTLMGGEYKRTGFMPVLPA